MRTVEIRRNWWVDGGRRVAYVPDLDLVEIRNERSHGSSFDLMMLPQLLPLMLLLPHLLLPPPLQMSSRSGSIAAAAAAAAIQVLSHG
jgi:hypothetical protein